MRKIYSLVLMAAMLLLGTKAWAALHPVKIATDEAKVTVNEGTPQYGSIDEAFALANGNTIVVIDVLQNATADSTLCIATKGDNVGPNVTLNLDTFKIESASFNTISLFKGTLRVTGHKDVQTEQVGRIICNGSKGTYTGTGIQVYGANTQGVAGWSNLIVEENVKVFSQKARGIQVYVFQDGKITTAEGFPQWAVDTIDYNTSGRHAYGVNIDVYGEVFGSNYGIQVTGSIKDSLNTADIYSWKLPYIHLEPSSFVHASANDGCDGIYGAGTAIWLVEGTVEGAYGIYMKSGHITINNAKVSSNGEYNPATYRDGHSRSGTSGSGTAILVEGNVNSNYEGHVSLIVEGSETEITASSGYAIAATTFDTENVDTIKVVAGTVTGGQEGCVYMEDEIGADVKEQGTIQGGNYNGDITDYLSDNTGIITQTEDEEGNIVWTVAEKEPTQEWHSNLQQATRDSLIEMSDTVRLTANVEVGYVALKNKARIEIPNGMTLTAGSIVMSANSVIEVEVGGRLIVDGASGIVANQNTNLIIHASEAERGYILLSPDVNGNLHPRATVQFVSKSYRNSGSDFRNQRFGIPTIGSMDSIKSSNDIPVGFSGYLNGSWTTLGTINNGGTDIDLDTKMNEPFVYYQMTCGIAKDQPHPTITMFGKLVGVSTPTLTTTSASSSTFANSFLGNLDLGVLFDSIETLPAGIEKTIYTYKPVASNTFVWKGYNNNVMIFNPNMALEPMQAFYLKNNGVVASITINYEQAVWNKRDVAYTALPDAAPVRNNSKGVYEIMAQLSIVADNEVLDDVYMLQDNQFSADYENGWDGEKMMNDDVNFYVMDEARQESFATNNLSNTYLGFSCETAGSYTLRCARINNNDMVLIDLENGMHINLVEGMEYTFQAEEASVNDYRFQIVGRHEMPTDIESVEQLVENGQGIFTITGQYIGGMNMWNNLPAGLYIVNGEKKVK